MGERFDDVDQLAVNTLRTLAMDAIEKANSGHPGAPMGLAPVAWTLFSTFLRHDPADPSWPDRDRFVLSGGHASMLLYGVLHLMGYDMTIDDIKAFRQWDSRTPGHPEVGHVPGVEMTTGPLGQGCATSVGMALAEVHLAENFNGAGTPIVNHRTWAVCGDGDLMEGVTAEAASLAGHLGLSKLCWIWDDNGITIEGKTDLAVSDDVEGRFRAYGWHVVRVDDANDLEALASAFDAAVGETDRPTLVAVRSHIGFSAPTKQDTAGAHGSPLGAEEIRGAKKNLGWPEDSQFFVPDAVAERGREIARRGADAHHVWEQRHDQWARENPDRSASLSRILDGRLPEVWSDALPVVEFGAKGPATRAASGTVINALAGVLPEMVGGSADLDPSCKTKINASQAIAKGSWGGRNLHFGIREHAMGAVLNGLALHGGIRPFGSTFLVFADYMRPAIRLAALMGLPVIYVFTHDSIWVGEDGPTHQPVEQVTSLRIIPNVVVLRPADANETAAAWAAALKRHEGPTALILSRQGLPILEGTAEGAQDGVARGAWCPVNDDGSPQVVLLATGSEVQLAVAASAELGGRGISARVVSMPSQELFDAQDEEYRRAILPIGIPVVAIEAGVTFGWERYTGADGATIGLDRFGASAPGGVVAEKLGFTVDRIVEAALKIVGKRGQE